MASLEPIMDFYKAFMTSAFLGGSRMYGVFLFFPLFTWAQLGQVQKILIAYIFASPNILLLYFTFENGVNLPLSFLASIALKELLIGILLGFAIGLPFWAVQATGDVIDLYRGASAANLFDPINAAESSIMGKFYSNIALTLFAIMGGITITIEILLRSYAAWPTLQLMPNVNWDTLNIIGRTAIETLTIAFMLGAPLMIVMILTDIVLLFIVRSARSLQVYDLSILIRNLAVLILAAPYFVFYIKFFDRVWASMSQGFDAILGPK